MSERVWLEDLKLFRDQVFATSGSRIWNSLPTSPKNNELSDWCFRRGPKMFLFWKRDCSALWLIFKSAPEGVLPLIDLQLQCLCFVCSTKLRHYICQFSITSPNGGVVDTTSQPWFRIVCHQTSLQFTYTFYLPTASVSYLDVRFLASMFIDFIHTVFELANSNSATFNIFSIITIKQFKQLIIRTMKTCTVSLPCQQFSLFR